MSNSEPVARDEFFDSLLGDFLDESGQLLDRLNENLLQLDDWVRSLADGHQQRCDDELMNEMFRSAHSLKGLSGMLGLGDINGLTHKVENVFDAARKDELVIDGDVVELMFQAVDRLVSLVDVLREPDTEAVECESVIRSIGELLQRAGADRGQTSQEDAERALREELAALAGQATEETTPGPVEESTDATPNEPSTPVALTSSDEMPSATVTPTVRDFFENLEDEHDPQSKYLSIFIDETELSLDNLTETLLTLEGGSNLEATERLLVTAHRIKGSAASIGLNRAAKLAHLMEDLLQKLVDTKRTLSAEATDAMLSCSDALRQHVETLKGGSPQADNFNQLAHQLVEADVSAPTEPDTSGPRAPQKVSSPPTGITIDKLRQQVQIVATDPDLTYIGAVTFEPNLPLVGLKASLLYEKVANLGEVCHFHPAPEGLDDLHELDGIEFGVSTNEPKARLTRSLRIAGVATITVEPLVLQQSKTPMQDKTTQPAAQPSVAATPQTPASQAPAPKTSTPRAQQTSRPGDTTSRPTETLRVDIDRLDHLMNLAGQLVINKARFTRIGDGLKTVLGAKQSSRVLGNVFSLLATMADGGSDQGRGLDAQVELENLRSHARRVHNDLETVRRDVDVLSKVRVSVNDLIEAIHQLDRVSDGIQQSVMDTRMLPIGPLFARFKRVIRDITRANGKSIKLVVNGEKTELDKRMIDELGDPLIHMVRNAADHGIESPEDRVAAGKPREGTVSLNAFHRGNSIIVEVSDDGKGLDPNGIRRKALDKGLVTEADLEKMTQHQIYQLIWEPGLSTAQTVTEVSGRGMGMDIVRSKIAELSGTVDLDSELGKGTTLTIKLPLTLAILPSLMVDIDSDIFAMPLESVVEIVNVNKQDLSTVHGQQTARVRGRVVSMVTLDEVFQWNQTETKDNRTNRDETTLVIVEEDGQELGLAVDSVLGEEDIVIKSMAENYRNVAGIAGASILGDGRVSLILDLAALIEMSSNSNDAIAAS